MKENIAPALGTLATPIDRLEPDPANPRRGDVSSIADSYERFGQRKPIVARRTGGSSRAPRGVIIAGNHQLEAARRLGWKRIAVVWVDDDETTATAYGLADNRSSDVATYDDQALVDLLQSLDAEVLELTGYEQDDVASLLRTIAETSDVSAVSTPDYARTVAVPRYEIVGEQPGVEELFDARRAAELAERIEAADVPEDVRAFLLLAAKRHVVFNYRKIAEFYPHAEPDVQQLMEESALVIIDVDDAILRGFVQFSETIAGLLGEERGE